MDHLLRDWAHVSPAELKRLQAVYRAAEAYAKAALEYEEDDSLAAEEAFEVADEQLIAMFRPADDTEREEE